MIIVVIRIIMIIVVVAVVITIRNTNTDTSRAGADHQDLRELAEPGGLLLLDVHHHDASEQSFKDQIIKL